jgi:hypothetical protein
MLYIQYTWWSGTHRTSECAGLARGFAIWGLDRIFTLAGSLKLLYRLQEPLTGNRVGHTDYQEKARREG